MDRKLITDKLGLPVTATDEEILAKLDTLMAAEATEPADATAIRTAEADAAAAKAAKDQMACSLTAETARANQAEAELKTAREAHANALLDAAEAAGRITKADRPAWLARLTGPDRETEANNLAAAKPVLNVVALNPERNRGEIADEKARRETVANAVEKIMSEKRVDYHTAWNLAKRDPALKPVFDAMKTPG